MSARLDDSFSSYTRLLTDAAHRVNRLALENAESMFGVQLKTFERNATATSTFWGELTQAGAADGYQALLPKGLQLARENLERLAAANQEVVGLGLKAGEALGELARASFDTPATGESGRTAR